jgi:stearoyl-CoA desaturase (delta-9 desaturase)
MTHAPARSADEKLDPWASLPFFAVHALALFVFQVGFHWREALVCLGLYYLRMFAITAGYHRYFSHRAYQTNRVFQFLLAFVGSMSAQKGVLWWAAHHRHHHRASDEPEDIHSPTLKGFWWSHAGWILCHKYDETRWENIRDFARYPELVWLNTYHLVPPTLLGAGLFFWGGWSMLVWGMFLSTVLLWHGTFTINSLSHVFGTRRYKSTDTSRNNFLLALLTCGEGWHNNHHFHQNTANQGWFWWEVDFTYYVLKALSWVGVVKKLRLPSHATQYAHLQYSEAERRALREEARGFRNPALVAERLARAQARVSGALQQAAEALPSAPAAGAGGRA